MVNMLKIFHNIQMLKKCRKIREKYFKYSALLLFVIKVLQISSNQIEKRNYLHSNII